MLVKSLLLVALGTISKALPKRGAHPWIGSFDLDDVTCTNTTLFDNTEAQARPEISRGDCTPFTLIGDRVGGMWGTHDRQIGFMYVHDAIDCTDTQVTIKRNQSERGFCVPVADLGGGVFAWNAIQGG